MIYVVKSLGFKVEGLGFRDSVSGSWFKRLKYAFLALQGFEFRGLVFWEFNGVGFGASLFAVWWAEAYNGSRTVAHPYPKP